MQPKEPDLGSQVFQDALLMAAPMSRGPTLQAVVEFQNQTPTGWEAREIRVRIRVQQGLPLQRGRYRDDTWELLFVLRIQGPAQGLCIHSETPSYIRNAIIPASRGPCKDFTLPSPSFLGGLFPMSLDFDFLSSKAQIWFLKPQSRLQTFRSICTILRFPLSSSPRPPCSPVNS